MPYDPRMLQMAQMGVGMMGPQQQGNPAAGAPQRPKQWWEQPMPRGPLGTPPDSQSANSSNQMPSPGLLQMLMLGGKPTYSGAPSGPSSGYSPWGMLGNMGMPGGAGWGGSGGAR